jgi:DNA-binding GntR family transcriptional regulator
MTKDAPKNKKTQVYTLLKDKIITVELKPGMPINEAVFAKDFGVSKTPIREALRQLEQEGFVENIPGRGSTISHITQNEIKDVFEIRQILESGVAARAAALGGNEELRNLRDECKQILDGGTDMEVYAFEWGSYEKNHTAIVRSLDNEYLVTIYTGLMERMTRIRNHFGQKYTRRRYHDICSEHYEILSAILAGDEKMAAEKMTAHLTNAGSFVLGL